MTNTTQLAACDFTKPRQLTGTANRALSGWLTTACALLEENWQSLLSCVTEIRISRIDSSNAQTAVRSLPDPAFAARIQIGPEGFTSLIAFPRPVLLAFVADMLGTLGDTWPEVKAFTPAETSMVELLFGEIARSISQAWPEIDPIECTLNSVVSRPIRSRIFAPADSLVRATISISTSLGEQSAILLMPREGLNGIGIVEQDSGEDVLVRPPPQMRNLAERLPVTMAVELGATSLTLAEMNSLTAGDVVVLDQRIANPLSAAVSGRILWRGMPCRLGQRQAFRITASGVE
jgi:flagellar motor switch protein FliM